ncbi:DUF3786 domain-containing protein [Hominifimenecus sp. rT4P-3]|uniref:DUF3786 domain-containing protein n=1 Tax=Hominifimenecus sp. rT4P-3 TaxID=3242979 RepID=UPI003DA4F6EF
MIAENKISNYEKMKRNMAAVFLQYDQEKMIRKFLLEYAQKYLFIPFAGRQYRINRFTGVVSWSNDSFQTEKEADYNEAMTIYDVLCYSKENCHLAHEWVNVGSLSTIQSGALAKTGNFFQNAGEYFDGKADVLAHACEALRGRKIKRGDVAYELELFPFLPIFLCFWEADEDFPASLQILIDKNILDYMHYETLMFAITHMLNQLKSKCEELCPVKAE